MKKILLVLIPSILVTNANAIELNGKLATGYDDNPFKLSDTLDHHNGWFLDTQLKAKQLFGDFRLRGSLENRNYEGDVDDADVTRIKFDGRYKKKHTILDKKASSSILLNYQQKDKTYVRRSTGQIGTFSGQTIKNRYDYDAWGADARTSITLSETIRTGLRFNFLNKNYQNYNITGLSNLDYKQYKLSNNWNYKHTKSSKFKFVISKTERDYDDKRQKTLLGSSINDTDLEYDYYSVSLAHSYKFSPKLKSKLKLEYEERKDNGSGYYDTDLLKTTAGLDYKIEDGLNLAVNLMYQDYEYVHNITIDEDDEGLPDKEGFTLKIDIEKDLGNVKNMPTTLFTGIRYDDYNSNDPVYEYDRVQIFAGIQMSFK